MRIHSKRWAMALATLIGGLFACSSAGGNLNVINTDCIVVTAVAGSGSGNAGKVNVTSVIAKIKRAPACAGKKICMFEYSVFIDRNGNGVEDMGENQISNSYDGRGQTTVTVAGGSFTYGSTSGVLRHTAKVTLCDGSVTNTKGVVTVK